MRSLQENDVLHAIARSARRAILVTLWDGERSERPRPAVSYEFRSDLAAFARP